MLGDGVIVEWWRPGVPRRTMIQPLVTLLISQYPVLDHGFLLFVCFFTNWRIPMIIFFQENPASGNTPASEMVPFRIDIVTKTFKIYFFPSFF